MLVDCVHGRYNWERPMPEQWEFRLLQMIVLRSAYIGKPRGVVFLWVNFFFFKKSKTSALFATFYITNKLPFLLFLWKLIIIAIKRRPGQRKRGGAKERQKRSHKWPTFFPQRLLPLQPFTHFSTRSFATHFCQTLAIMQKLLCLTFLLLAIVGLCCSWIINK